MTRNNENKYLFWLIIAFMIMVFTYHVTEKVEDIVKVKSEREQYLENRIIGLEGKVKNLEHALGMDIK